MLSMAVQVAYDITFLAEYTYRTGEEVGITRVIRSVMQGMQLRDDVELTPVGLCGGDAAYFSFLTKWYLEQAGGQEADRFRHTFGSRLGLSCLYRKLYDAYLSKDYQRLPRSSPKAVPLRGALKLLRSVDTYTAFNDRDYDVFHSPFMSLPPKHVTKGVPRLLTIYDLIPLIAPHFGSHGQTASMRAIIDSIDVQRDWVTCISEYTKQEFCEYTGMSSHRVFVTPLAADKHFQPVTDQDQIAAARRRYHIPEGAYLLTLAALQPRKNLAHLVSCFFRLLSEAPDLDVSLVLVGPQGWMYDEIIQAAGACPELRSKVIFTGYVPEEDLSAIYSGAQAFIYPSLYEGFGLPPLEAMQCGVPVITSNTTSLPEVVGDAGITVGPTDAESLCRAMHALLTDGAFRQELSRKGLERSERFSWAKCADQLAHIYKAIADAH